MKKVIDEETGQLSELQGLHITMQQHPPRFYEPVGVSVTNPDPGLSIREMVEKYASGEPGQVYDVEYDGEGDEVGEEHAMPHDFDLSDVSENQEFIDKVKISAEDLNKKALAKKALAGTHSDEPDPRITDESGGNARNKAKSSEAKTKTKAGVRPDSSGSGSDENSGGEAE